MPFGHGKQFLNSNDLAARIFGGWELSGIATARTGLPVNISMTRKAAALPDGNTSGQRPEPGSRSAHLRGDPSVNGWFNPAAFAAPANGTWGNLGRYIANGPGNYEIDSSLQKRFRLTERLALNVRAAAYNLLNHPQYSNPSGSLGSLTGSAPVSAGFGKITSILNTGAVGSGAPRRVEFMLRAEF